MSDNLSDIIIVGIIWIAAAAVGVATKEIEVLGFAIAGSGLYVYLSR